MAMKVMYNAGAQIALGALNQNNKQADNTLAKLASGQKFVGAQENSSSYAISEKMLEQIRSLFQDDQNVQNGSSMVKTAERAIDQIVQNLRTMKELAIDAANDSNTDDDRRIIQKEIDQRREVINDIALGTKYNGKILLDGRYGWAAKPFENGTGGKNNTVQNIKSAFTAGSNSKENTSPGMKSGGTNAPDEWKFTVDKSFTRNSSGGFSVELNFSAMKVSGSYPTALHGQGFTILCGGCMQYVNILFDASKTAEQSIYDNSSNTSENGVTNSEASEYTIGVKDVTSAKNLGKAIFEGIVAARNGSVASNSVLVDSNHTLMLTRDSNGKIFLSKDRYGPDMQFLEGTIPNPVKNPIPEVKVEKIFKNSLWIQHGTHAGQRLHVFINDMQTKSLGLDDTEVTTREKANDAIGTIDSAIETALNEATNMGAYLQRLETAFANVVTMRENAQGSESVIRDADMAKEISEYMKYNILSQSAQAMLAQENQNGSFVLGMLQ